MRLVLGLVAGLLVLQLALLGLATLAGRRLTLPAVLLGWMAPLVLLAPWLTGRVLLVPCNVLERIVPGAEEWRLPTPHATLNDTFYQLLPWEIEVRRALAARRLPLWSDRLDGGSSPWSNPQAQVLSPLAMLARAVPVEHHLLALLALKVMLAAEGAWVLARRLGARSLPALVAGTSVALGGGIVAWSLFPLSTAVAWAPWVAAAVVALARGARRGAVVALALGTAALLLAGHPEAALSAVAMAAIVGLWVRARRVPLRRLVALAAAGGILGTALAAPLLAPFTLAAARSLRVGERLAMTPVSWLPPPHGLWFAGDGWRFFLGPWSPRVMGTPYGPTILGPWDWPVCLAAYAGLAAAAGAVAALASNRRPRATPLLLAWFLGALCASRFVPLDALLERLPVVRMVEPTRLLPVATVALAIAAALGWDALLRGRETAPRVAAAVTLALGVGIAPAPSVAGLALLLLVAAVLLRVRPRLATVALAAALVLDLVPWARLQLPRDEPALFYPRTAFVDHLARVASVPGGPWRVAGEGFMLYPSLLTVYGLDEVRVHDPLAPRAQIAVLATAFGFAPSSERYFSTFSHVEHPLLDFLGVRALVSNFTLPEKHRLQRVDNPIHSRRRNGRWVQVQGRLTPYQLYRNPQALPRWFLPVGVDLVPSAQTLAWIRDLRDARVVALFAEQARGWQPPPQEWDGDAVRALAAQPGRIDLAVAGAGERLLATSLPGPFGWHARAAGRELQTMTVDGAFLGLRVPAGVSRLELRYTPPGLLAGTLAALAAALVLAGVTLDCWRRRRAPLPARR